MSSYQQQNLEMIPEWKEQRVGHLLPPAGGIPHCRLRNLSLHYVYRCAEHLWAHHWGLFPARCSFLFRKK